MSKSFYFSTSLPILSISSLFIFICIFITRKLEKFSIFIVDFSFSYIILCLFCSKVIVLYILHTNLSLATCIENIFFHLPIAYLLTLLHLWLEWSFQFNAVQLSNPLMICAFCILKNPFSYLEHKYILYFSKSFNGLLS